MSDAEPRRRAALSLLERSGAPPVAIDIAGRWLDGDGPPDGEGLWLDQWAGTRPGAGTGFVVHGRGPCACDPLWGKAERVASRRSARWAWTQAERLRDLVAGRPERLAVGVGFDERGRLQRLKFYVEEEAVGGRAFAGPWVRRWLESLPALQIPGETFDSSWDIVGLDLWADGRCGARLYRGGKRARDLDRSLTNDGGLAEVIARAVPFGAAWHYATLRLSAGTPELAGNVIFEHVRCGVRGSPGERALLWTVADALGRRSGAPSFDLALRSDPEVLVVPTAASIEADGGDLYVAAFPRSHPPTGA